MLSMDAVEAAKSGHPGMPMGMADIAEVLWNDYLKFNPANGHWHDRDRFVLSNGHGSMLLYSVAYLTGYPIELDEIKKFRQLGSRSAGHPEDNRDWKLTELKEAESKNPTELTLKTRESGKVTGLDKNYRFRVPGGIERALLDYMRDRID